MRYLDNSATTQVNLEVVSAMLPYFQTEFGNASSIHHLGVSALDAIQNVRNTIAERLRCKESEIIFTGSGSESNTLAIVGFAFANRVRGTHLITTSIEHASVLESFRYLESNGFQVTYLAVSSEGFVDPEHLREAIRPDTILVSIAHVNNEIGTIQPIEDLLDVAGKVCFHSDLVQSFLKTDFDVARYRVGLASFSGHKIHAPKGIGFLFRREGIRLQKLIHGGHQENNLRSGTENTPSIVGLGKAISLYDDSCIPRMRTLQAYLVKELLQLDGIYLNGPKDLQRRVCNNVNISTEYMEGERLVRELSRANIFVSSGSACTSRHSRVSHVLLATGCPPRFIQGNVRISFSRDTEMDSIESFLEEYRRILETKTTFHLTTRNTLGAQS